MSGKCGSNGCAMGGSASTDGLRRSSICCVNSASTVRRDRAIRLVVLLLIPAMQVAVVRFINPPLTLPMLIDQGGAMFSRAPKPALLYRWTDLPQIPEMFLEHLWISQDERFFQHEGFDWKEMELALKEAERKGETVRGASTITNQCARSIFLWQGRSWIRKGLESVLHDLDGGAVAEAAHPGTVCERDRDGTRDLRGRSCLAALFRRQLARFDAGGSRPCWRQSCRIRRAGIRRSRAGYCVGASNVFCAVNRARTSPSSCFGEARDAM